MAETAPAQRCLVTFIAYGPLALTFRTFSSSLYTTASSSSSSSILLFPFCPSTSPDSRTYPLSSWSPRFIDKLTDKKNSPPTLFPRRGASSLRLREPEPEKLSGEINLTNEAGTLWWSRNKPPRRSDESDGSDSMRRVNQRSGPCIAKRRERWGERGRLRELRGLVEMGVGFQQHLEFWRASWWTKSRNRNGNSYGNSSRRSLKSTREWNEIWGRRATAGIGTIVIAIGFQFHCRTLASRFSSSWSWWATAFASGLRVAVLIREKVRSQLFVIWLTLKIQFLLHNYLL